MEKVTVIGGGNGAFATAADLTIRGNQVTLFELPRFAAGLSEVIEKKAALRWRPMPITV